MSVNTIQTAAVIQSELDKAAVEQATSGWMEVNSSLVKYNCLLYTSGRCRR